MGGGRGDRLKDGCELSDGLHLVLAKCGKGCSRGWILQGRNKILGCACGCVSGREFWHGTVVWEKLDRFGNAFGGGAGDVNTVAPVVFLCSTDVPAVNAVGGPRAAIGWGFVHEDSGAGGCKGGTIKIECTI